MTRAELVERTIAFVVAAVIFGVIAVAIPNLGNAAYAFVKWTWFQFPAGTWVRFWLLVALVMAFWFACSDHAVD